MAEATLQVQIKALVDGLDQLKQLGASIGESVSGFDDLGKAGEGLTEVLGGIQNGVKSYLDTIKESSSSNAEFAAGIDQLVQSLEEQRKGFQDQGQAGEFLAGVLGGIIDGLKDYAAQVRKGGDENDSFKKKLEELKKGFEEAKEQATELLKKIGEFTGISALVGSALSALSIEKFFEAGFEGATAFEDAMARLAVTSGKTKEELADVGEEAEKIGSGLGFEASESVETLTHLTAGIGDVDEAMKALQPTLELARVTQMGLAEASQFVTTALTQYGLSADQASEVTDTLVVASQTAGIAMSELVRQFQLVGPFAANAGLSIKDTATILAGVADAGLRGRIAYSALIEVFQQLGDSSSEFRRRLAGLGIDSTNLGTVFQQLAQKGTLAEVALSGFSDRTRAALRKLLQDGGANLDAVSLKLASVSGATARAAAEIENTLSETAKRAKQAFTSLAEALVLPTLPVLTAAFQRLEKGLADFAGSDAFKRLQEAFVNLAEGAIQFLANALSSVDFDTLSKDIANFTTEFGERLGQIENFANRTGHVLGIVADSVALVFNTIKTVVASAVEVVVGAAAVIVKVLQLTAQAQGNFQAAAILQHQFDLIKESVKDLDKVAEDAAVKVGKNIKSIGDHAVALGDDAQHGAKGVEELNKATADSEFMEKYGKDVEHASTQLKEFDTRQTSILGALEEVKGTFDELRPSFDNVVAGFGNANVAIAGIGTAFGEADTSAAALEVKLAATAAQMKALADAGKGTGKEFADLQVQYNDLAAKLGAGGFDSARAQVLELNRAIDDEIKKFTALQRAGKDTAQATADFEQRMRDLNNQLSQLSTQRAAEAIDGLVAQFKTLGVQSRADLQTLAESARQAFEEIAAAANQSEEDQNQVRAAFLAYAQKAIAALRFETEATRQSVEAKLLQRAAVLGVTDQLQGLIAKFNELGNKELGKGLSDGLDNVNQGFQQANESGQEFGVTLDGVQFRTKEEANEFERMGGKAGALGPVLDELSSFYSEFSAVSSNAVSRFTKVMEEFFNGAHAFSVQALTDGTNIIKLGEAAAAAGKFIEDAIASQRQGVADLANQFTSMSDAAIAALTRVHGGADRLADGLAGDAAAARAGKSAFDLLGAADLSPLASALDGIADRVRQVKEQALQATQALKSMLSSTQDQIDEILGNQKAIEDRRHEEALAQIDALKAQGADPETIRKAIEAENRLHNLKLQNIRDEQRDREEAQQRQHDQEVADQQAQQQAQQQAAQQQQQNLDTQLETQKQITAEVQKVLPNIPTRGTLGGGVIGGVLGVGAGTQVPGGGGTLSAPGLGGGINVTVNIDTAVGDSLDDLGDKLTRRIQSNLQRLGALSR